ncbi:helix-turn-helix transcriptional regulator [Mycobacterium sp. NPDC050853]|uniref:helix-turn-helix domain-containing protein n=1 Tax=Mycobacterium sp. NPDC050853 TaxID=3155160 RepID=UPI0033EA79F2
MADIAKANIELGPFLRARRAELTRAKVGLPPAAGIRRVSGLRREEVAQLAGISADYYARLEQGRLSSVSEYTLAAVCEALRLNPDQETYVRTLARKPAIPNSTGDMTVDASTRNLLAHLTDVPVLVLGPYLDVLGWNTLASALFLDFAQLPREHRNLVWLAFLETQVRAMYLDWESVGRTCVAYLRMDAARRPNDPRLAELVEELSARDRDFQSWWTSQTVAHHSTSGRKRYRHPVVGEFTLDWQIYQRTEAPETMLAFLVPTPNTQSDNALGALARIAAHRPESTSGTGAYQTRT